MGVSGGGVFVPPLPDGELGAAAGAVAAFFLALAQRRRTASTRLRSRRLSLRTCVRLACLHVSLAFLTMATPADGARGEQQRRQQREDDAADHRTSAGRAKPEAPGMMPAASTPIHCSSSEQ